MREQKYKYNVINKSGKEEPWTGVFKNLQKSDEWYQEHGKFHEQRGHKLIRRPCISTK